jgi:GMP synthase (glutamine-hydrolysing)
MRALAIVHQPDAGPGVFAEALGAKGVELEHWPIADGPAPAEPSSYDAVLVFGGSMHTDHEARHPWLAEEKAILAGLIERRVPLLGMCLGSQLVAEAAGAEPRRASEPEIGWHEVELTREATGDPLLGGLPSRFQAFQWHSYEAPLPPGATALARSPVCLQAFRLEGPAWGIQFHAEVSREDADHWIADYRSDTEAVGIGLDPEALRAETHAAIGAWNDVGRAMCERWIDAIRA